MSPAITLYSPPPTIWSSTGTLLTDESLQYGVNGILTAFGGNVFPDLTADLTVGGMLFPTSQANVFGSFTGIGSISGTTVGYNVQSAGVSTAIFSSGNTQVIQYVVQDDLEQRIATDILQPDPLAGFGEYSIAGWDGDDAAPISEVSITAAREAARALQSTGFNPAIAPGADGTIGFEWWNGTACVFADFGPTNRVRTYLNLGDGTPSVKDNFWWSGEASANALKALLEQLYQSQVVFVMKSPRRQRHLSLRFAA